MLKRTLLFLVSAGLLHGSGWNLMFGGELKIIPDLLAVFSGEGMSYGGLSYGDMIFNADSYLIQDMSYFLSGQLAVINVNDLFYGVFNSHRYFNSPILEWIGLGLGVGLFWSSITSIFDEIEEESEIENK